MKAASWEGRHNVIVAWVSCGASCGCQARKICRQLESEPTEAVGVGCQRLQYLTVQSCEVHFGAEFQIRARREGIFFQS